ncbi:hypothetical protein VTL71DRAFT_12732 [Oculimacula yallundae]|uniref:Uncharacterized protein n=1 Tax=Oculimacula yallundae TaxID=86028 RepID=A0ABR4CNC2_9HELO
MFGQERGYLSSLGGVRCSSSSRATGWVAVVRTGKESDLRGEEIGERFGGGGDHTRKCNRNGLNWLG